MGWSETKARAAWAVRFWQRGPTQNIYISILYAQIIEKPLFDNDLLSIDDVDATGQAAVAFHPATLKVVKD